MIRKIVAILVLVPLALLIVLFAIANRAPVLVSLDPFDGKPPLFSLNAPLFAVLLVVLIAGVVVGGAASWARQSKWRRRARRLTVELARSRAETETLRRQLEAGAAAQASIATIAYRHPSAA